MTTRQAAGIFPGVSPRAPDPGPPDPDPPEPRLGALLRLAGETVHAALYERTAAAGYRELRPAHFRLLRFPGPDGVRPSELAQRLGTSKQAITPLLNELEEWGYLERRTDADDLRGRVVRLTRRGWRLLQTIRRLHAEIEADWESRLGPERFRTLLGALRDIVPARPGGTAPDRAPSTPE